MLAMTCEAFFTQQWQDTANEQLLRFIGTICDGRCTCDGNGEHA
jgi:hypothetical protein